MKLLVMKKNCCNQEKLDLKRASVKQIKDQMHQIERINERITLFFLSLRAYQSNKTNIQIFYNFI